MPLPELFLQLYPNKESCRPQTCSYLTFLVLWATISEAVTHERGKSDCEALCFDASHWFGVSEPREIHIEMYWNKQTRNKPEAKKRGFYILIILWFWFLPRIAAIQWNPASTQVLQKCANDLPASGSNPSNTRKACLRQRTSAQSLLCWCKSPLPWEQSLILGRAVPDRDVRRPLLSGGAQLPLRDSDQTPPAPPQHSDPSEGEGTNTGGQSCQLKLEELSLARRQVKNDREQSPTKLYSSRALLFDSVHLTETQPALGWQQHNPESLFSYITMTLCIFNWNLPFICVFWQPEGGIQRCSWRQVGIPEHLKLRRQYSVFQLEELCPDAPCSQQAPA